MKRKDVITLAGVGLVAAVVSFVVAGMLFSTPAHRGTKVKIADPIITAFPDVKNDPAYNSFLNTNALNPAQPVQIGNTQNTQPFNSGSQ